MSTKPGGGNDYYPPGGGGGGGGGGGCSGGGGNSAVSSTSPVKNNHHLTYQHGHSFIKKTFHSPRNCHYCSEKLWGLIGQGYMCEGKNLGKQHICMKAPFL